MAQTITQTSYSRRRLAFGWRLLLVLYFTFVLIIIFFPDKTCVCNDHYYFQAQSWLHGRLDIDNAPQDYQDVVTYNGHRYLPLGPLPAVLTLPFVAILGENYHEILLVYPLIALTVWVVWRLLGKLKLTYANTRPWLVTLFFLSTVYFASATRVSGPWFIAHVVTTLFMFLGIDEALGKRRGWLMGLYIGLAAASRFTAAFSFPFFLVLLAYDKPLEPTLTEGEPGTEAKFLPLPVIFRRFVLFGIGLAVPLGATFVLNYFRFHSFLETGYNAAALGGTGTLDQARAAGLFSLAHLPKNLYYFLMAMPQPTGPYEFGDPAANPVLSFPYLRPSSWGMSIFLTTPAIIYVFRARLQQPLVKAAWLGAIMTAIPILTYYGIGWKQFGYRYALDFTPLLWLLIVVVLRNRDLNLRRPTLPVWLIILGCAVNLWGAYWLPFLVGQAYP